jgi:hypothetical protein
MLILFTKFSKNSDKNQLIYLSLELHNVSLKKLINVIFILQKKLNQLSFKTKFINS